MMRIGRAERPEVKRRTRVSVVLRRVMADYGRVSRPGYRRGKEGRRTAVSRSANSQGVG